MDIAVGGRDDISLVMRRAIGFGHSQKLNRHLALIGSVSPGRGKGDIGIAVGQEAFSSS